MVTCRCGAAVAPRPHARTPSGTRCSERRPAHGALRGLAGTAPRRRRPRPCPRLSVPATRPAAAAAAPLPSANQEVGGRGRGARGRALRPHLAARALVGTCPPAVLGTDSCCPRPGKALLPRGSHITTPIHWKLGAQLGRSGFRLPPAGGSGRALGNPEPPPPDSRMFRLDAPANRLCQTARGCMGSSCLHIWETHSCRRH